MQCSVLVENPVFWCPGRCSLTHKTNTNIITIHRLWFFVQAQIWGILKPDDSSGRFWAVVQEGELCLKDVLAPFFYFDCLVRWFASGCFHRIVRTTGSSTEACTAERGSISSRLALCGLNVVADRCESDFTNSAAAHPTGLNYLCFCLPLSTNAVITH